MTIFVRKNEVINVLINVILASCPIGKTVTIDVSVMLVLTTCH